MTPNDEIEEARAAIETRVYYPDGVRRLREAATRVLAAYDELRAENEQLRSWYERASATTVLAE